MKSLIRTVALATALAAVALVPVAGAQSNNWQHHNGYQNHDNNRANNSYRGDRSYRGYRGDRYYHHNDNGAALGLLGGLAAGAVIGGVIGGQQRTQGWYDYCARTYRSFNPQTGTYRGYDGRDHACVAR